MTEDRGGAPHAESGGKAAGPGRPAPAFRAWIVAILAAAILSAGATLLLGGALRADSPSAPAPAGCGAGCCDHAGR